jgi:hypothetical protein
MEEKRKRGRPKKDPADKPEKKYTKAQTRAWMNGARNTFYDKIDEDNNKLTGNRFLDLN